jgi:glycosyltransferase involved in cell wall biosynthesis
MHKPVLTIAITTFERPRYLRDCLASIAAQTFMDFRILILDNASEASYQDVLAEFAALPITYQRNSENIGASRNIERAFSEAQETEFVIVFHDDDLMHPRMLEWQIAFLQANPRMGFVASELSEFADGTPPPREVWSDAPPEADLYEGESALARALLGGVGLCFGSAMYRSRSLDPSGMDFETYSMYWDRPFLLDLARRGPCAVYRAPLVLYRIHAAQDSRSDVLVPANLVSLMSAYRTALPSPLSESDRALFFAESARFLTDSYVLLSEAKRPSAARFVRACRRAGVLRLRDLTPHQIGQLLRFGGHSGLARTAQRLWRRIRGTRS